ncbi:hypothetical protein [Symmachiella dynata]|uniref:hypothetical protein n=1 Tax=Symmachiella dynata TaxID=2527995 RepID=UPI0030EF9642
MLTAFICAVLGMGIGAALGQWAPGYYRTMFSIDSSSDFAPLQTGIGLGLTQGLFAGLLLGVLVVAFMLWNDNSLIETHTDEKPVPRGKIRGVFRSMSGLILTVTFVALLVGAFILGSNINEHVHNLQAGNERYQVLSPILQDERFPDVAIEPISAGQIFLTGHVADQQTRDELLNELQHAFGDATAATLIEGVTVGK